MKVTETNIYQYLHKRDLLNKEEVLKGNFMVQPVETRNYNMKILINEKDSLFVKQMANDQISNGLFQREVATYTIFQNAAKQLAIAERVPKLLDHNLNQNIMVTELVYNSSNLNEYYFAAKTLDPTLAVEQAQILFDCHSAAIDEEESKAFPKALPWVLQLDQYQAHEFFIDNAFSTQVISLIKSNPVLQTELLKLASTWKPTSLIHGDIKWINFLITSNQNGLTQKLIDWELADIGDPLWDVAGLIQSYISTWMQSIDETSANYKLYDHLTCYDIKDTAESAKAFLFEYIRLQNIPTYKHHEFFEKVIQLTAARIIQTSLEEVTYLSEIKANSMRHVQLAFNILKDPMDSLDKLFNIKLELYV